MSTSSSKARPLPLLVAGAGAVLLALLLTGVALREPAPPDVAHASPRAAAHGGGEATPAVPPAQHAPAAEDVPEAETAPPPAQRLPAPPLGDAPDYHDPVSEAAQTASGAYFSGPYLRRRGARGVIGTLRAAGMNAAVIDLKDGQGRVTYDSAVPQVAAQVRHFIDDPAALVRALRAEGVHTIARVVCFSDPVMPLAHPERAIQDARPGRRGRPWVSWGTGGTWLDPFSRDNHDMVLALVIEAASFGFDEIQLDYIRFPVDEGTEYALYPAQDDRARSDVLLELLRRIDAAIPIPLGVDVFGLTAFDFGDHSALGQDLEQWTPHVEIFTPMLYLNAMTNWGRQLQNRPHSLIAAGSSQLRNRLGPLPVIRPFIQAFPQGADSFDEDFIADQIRGARAGRADGVLFWHPRNDYHMLLRGVRGPARGLAPFSAGDRGEARARLARR